MNAAYDKRIKQAEEAIAILSCTTKAKVGSHHEVRSEKGGGA